MEDWKRLTCSDTRRMLDPLRLRQLPVSRPVLLASHILMAHDGNRHSDSARESLRRTLHIASLLQRIGSVTRAAGSVKIAAYNSVQNPIAQK